MTEQHADHVREAGSRDFGSEVHGGADRWSRDGVGFETRAIHAGQDPDPTTGAVVVPIYQTSTYVQQEVGQHRGYEYSRSGNPTRTALETCLAALEGGRTGLAFASGLAAEDCLLRTVARPGAHVVIPDDAYGGTYRLFAQVLRALGGRAHPGAARRPRRGARGDAPRDRRWSGARPRPTRCCRCPTSPGSPRSPTPAGARLVVDNTFASPYLQQPLALGADVVVHSTTKYLGGHSDVVGGALVAADAALGEELAYHQNALGGVAGAFDSWLVLRGAKTLGVRMDRHSENAAQGGRPAARSPGRRLRALPGPAGATPGTRSPPSRCAQFGGMVSFRLAGGEQAALDVCKATQVFTLGESLGGVESLIEHPGRMTHASVAGSQLEVPSDLVRLSVGIESATDLLADLDRRRWTALVIRRVRLDPRPRRCRPFCG